MSSKRKDSHPTRAPAVQEEGDGEESALSITAAGGEGGAWTTFNIHKNNNNTSSNNNTNSLQLSQLGHLLTQNGNGSLSPSRTADTAREDSVMGDDTSSTGNKEDEDEDEDEDGADDKFDNVGDPERLKAFNMFVRLFVDENLDRHVPISKQPKEKIQAIIDSCARQFPEFSERARKRIRTYLKSCRRTKRSREQAGLDTNNRPTPPHMTSVHAEQLLARACENEAENAKRMRMGMEPISQPLPLPPTYSTPLDIITGSPLTMTLALEKPKNEYKPEQLASLLAAGQHHQQQQLQQQQQQLQQQQTAVVTGVANITAVNGTTAAMYRQALQQNPGVLFSPAGSVGGGGVVGNSPVALSTSPLLSSSSPASSTVVASSFLPGSGNGAMVTNGNGLAAAAAAAAAAATTNGQDGGGGKKPPLLNHKLNGTEMAAVRQLITGYRESAAFLLRSADELEHLLQIQPKL